MGDYSHLSKFLSLVLRHKPEAVGIELDRHGWADTESLLAGINATGRQINQEILEEIVAADAKQRYSFNADKTAIRANQGHSLPIDLELQEQAPPDCLFHGTATRFWKSIQAEGLKPMGRQYVHLSKDPGTAAKVGQRHGSPLVLQVDSRSMHQDGHPFYLSQNGVWLTPKVPASYLEPLEHRP